MTRRVIAAIVIALVAINPLPTYANQQVQPSPSSGRSLRESVDAVTFEQKDDDEDEGMRPVFKWTGGSLVIGGLSHILLTSQFYARGSADRNRQMILGLCTVGAGVTMLIIGTAKAAKARKKSASEIVPMKDGVVVRSRITF